MIEATLRYSCEPLNKELYELEDIHKNVDLPFVPFAGLLLKVDEGSDFAEVDQVFLDISTGHNRLEVYLKEPEILMSW